MLRFNIIVFVPLILLFFSCTNSSKKSVSVSEHSSSLAGYSQSTIDAYSHAVIAERISATNTAPPTYQHSVYNVLDNNKKTAWQTPQKSGLNEGIMIHFPKKKVFSFIRISQKKAQKHATIKACDIFINGKKQENKAVPNTLFPIKSAVQSLFIRITDCAETIHINTPYKGDDSEMIYKSYLPDSLNIAVSEIEFFDADTNKITVLPPLRKKCTVRASSTLTPKRAYSIENIIDNKTDFCWAEGNKNTSGTDEHITFTFTDTVHINNIALWNGYQRSQSHFKNNARAARISFKEKNGDTYSFPLEDSPEKQVFSLPKILHGTTFTLTIDSVFPGKKYTDLALSEILFYYQNIPIKPINSSVDSLHTHSLSIPNKQLQSVLNRNIHYGYAIEQNSSHYTTKSFLLRSNYSFVSYNENKLIQTGWATNFKKATQIAEGGWEYISGNDSQATIRIFGKMYTSSYKKNVYTGIAEQDNTNIFQDYITITDSTIEGKTYIEGEIELPWHTN
ncbi:MAG: hypothetical protein R6U95_09350 [Bacteroidales bacterium]